MYKLIYDEKQVNLFQKKYYSPNEVYLTFMSARKKYNKELPSNIGCFKRNVVSGKTDLVKALRHYELARGTYVDFEHDVVLPENSLVTYASINARDVQNACKELTKHVIDVNFSGNELCIKDARIETYLQKNAKKEYIGIDLDTKEEKVVVPLFSELYDKIPKFDIIETRGGFHIIIHKKHITAETGKFLYKDMKKKYSDIDDIKNDIFSPIPGTIQGGFEVKFVQKK